MANLKSSKKDIKRSEKRRLKNQSAKSALKTFVKKVRVATTPEDAQKAMVTAQSALDKATQNGVIHKNQAARRKSRAAKAANKVTSAQ
jgi:small subunit ribosomal protein S20